MRRRHTVKVQKESSPFSWLFHFLSFSKSTILFCLHVFLYNSSFFGFLLLFWYIFFLSLSLCFSVVPFSCFLCAFEDFWRDSWDQNHIWSEVWSLTWRKKLSKISTRKNCFKIMLWIIYSFLNDAYGTSRVLSYWKMKQKQ